jgi:cbb3-type cytochrome oxidase maturation protein
VSVIFLLIGFSLLVAIGFLIAFFWSIKSGQFDDDYTPSVRILFDDETDDAENPPSENNSEENTIDEQQETKPKI